MDNKRTLHQAPSPKVLICDPEKGRDGSPKLTFDLNELTTLQSYNFSTSVNDPKGAFTLTFYPDDDRVNNNDPSIFDQIRIMDIVQIIESERNHGEYPDFTGVIRAKKHVVQMTDAGPKRSILVSGHSIAGLVQEFRISMDLQAMEITKQIANEKQLSIELTLKLLDTKNRPLSVKFLVETVWKYFLDLSSKYGKLSNCKVAEYIEKWMGEDLFTFDDSEFYYPVANIFNRQNTQSFYDLVEGLVPKPVYEIFPYTADKGVTKIMIRVAPFDSDTWGGKLLEDSKKQINPILVKSFDVQQSDNEVYTVYFAYLEGSAIDMDRAILLATQDPTGDPRVSVDNAKFGKYGYRPLFISMRGYGKSREDDKNTADRIKNLSERLKNWFCHLDEMYTGKIVMSLDISSKMPQPGEKISFLGGEFYVVDSSHQWNYGGNPEITLTISRGGDYSQKEKEIEIEVKKEHAPVKYTVKSGDTLRQIAIDHNGAPDDWWKIMSCNQVLVERKAAGEVVDESADKDRSPIIEPGDNLTIPWLGEDEFEIKTEKVKAADFSELKDVTKRYQEFKNAMGFEEWKI